MANSNTFPAGEEEDRAALPEHQQGLVQLQLAAKALLPHLAQAAEEEVTGQGPISGRQAANRPALPPNVQWGDPKGGQGAGQEAVSLHAYIGMHEKEGYERSRCTACPVVPSNCTLKTHTSPYRPSNALTGT